MSTTTKFTIYGHLLKLEFRICYTENSQFANYAITLSGFLPVPTIRKLGAVIVLSDMH